MEGYRYDPAHACAEPKATLGLTAIGFGRTTGTHTCLVSPAGDLYVAFVFHGEELCDERWHHAESDTLGSTLTEDELELCARALADVELVVLDGGSGIHGLAALGNPCDE